MTSITATSPLQVRQPVPLDKSYKMEALFREYGWDATLLLSPDLTCHPKYHAFLEFLYDSRLIYALRGYELSLQNSSSPMKEGIRMIDGHPHILKENEWVRWEEIINTFHYDRIQGITTRNDAAAWNYLYPQGLVPKSIHDQIVPVHQLSKEERGRLYQNSKKFFTGTQDPVTLEKNRCAYVQIVSHGESASDRLGGHVTVRLIDQKGRVYSIETRVPPEEEEARKLSLLFGTCTMRVSSLDYKEFSKFDLRRVTTVPVDLETFNKIFNKVRHYAETPIRYNFIHQNCVTFAADILHEAGIPLDTRSTSLAEIAFHGLAPKRMIDASRRTGQFFSGFPSCIKTPASYGMKCLTFIPSSLLTMGKNTAFLALGAGREATAPTPGAENVLDNSQRLTSFNHLFTHWTDFFKDQPVDITYRVIDWQLEQGSTETYAFQGPKFYVVPQSRL